MTESIIDTDILSYYLKGNRKVIAQFEKYLYNFPQINISIVTHYEIKSGLYFINAERKLKEFEEFINYCKIHLVTKESSETSAKLYASLRQKGTPIDDIDLLIAGIAIENDFTFVTNNEKDFKKIKELKTSNWT